MLYVVFKRQRKQMFFVHLQGVALFNRSLILIFFQNELQCPINICNEKVLAVKIVKRLPSKTFNDGEGKKCQKLFCAMN